MNRRDLDPGDVFVYVGDPHGDTEDEGRIRYVDDDSYSPWFEGAERSPDFGPLEKCVLDWPVIRLQKPEGRLETRAEIRARIRDAADVLLSLSDEI